MGGFGGRPLDYSTGKIFITTNTGNPTGINDLPNDNLEIQFYPNPSTDAINIKAIDKMETLNVYAEDGKLIYNRNINSDNYLLNISSFETGIYFVEITTTKGREVKRINKI